MDQTLVNGIFTAFGALSTFVLTSIWQAVKELQASDKELAQKAASIEVLVAGQYLRREEFNEVMGKVFHKLEVIEERVAARS